jgi:hypothetical protein
LSAPADTVLNVKVQEPLRGNRLQPAHTEPVATQHKSLSSPLYKWGVDSL